MVDWLNISGILIGDLVRCTPRALREFWEFPLPASIGLVTRASTCGTIVWVKFTGSEPRPLNVRWLEKIEDFDVCFDN